MLLAVVLLHVPTVVVVQFSLLRSSTAFYGGRAPFNKGVSCCKGTESVEQYTYCTPEDGEKYEVLFAIKVAYLGSIA